MPQPITLMNLIMHPNDIVILGFALLFYATFQLFRRTSERD